MLYEKKHETLFFYIVFFVLAIFCGYLLCRENIHDNRNGAADVREQIADTRREQHEVTRELERAAEANRKCANIFEENRAAISDCRAIVERVHQRAEKD